MSLSAEQACVYSAEVMHRRVGDVPYRFRYRVFSLLLDIDALDEIAAASPLFSRNRLNLLSFHDADHLPPGESDLRAWVERVLASGGIDGRGLRIRLLCFPRVLGWVFNPISLWYCETFDGRPAAVIAEVRNTFGERHCYLLKPAGAAGRWPLRDRHAKEFHVSPFIAMQACYEFRLSRPDRRLRVAIREFHADRLVLVATQTGERRPFATPQLLLQVLRVPLQTLKVLMAIHWQALKIWLKGARFHRKPPPPIEEVT
ncbi:MAG: DUF1365 domain-containing protein [Chromatiaceae bacterium]|jgi:hypothetical protein|nr:DUF1365 domain-containing protein [Chromatiaceae bacterium]